MKNRLNVGFTDKQMKYLRSLGALSGNSIPSIVRTAITNQLHRDLDHHKAKSDKKYLEAFAGGRELDNK